jgi:hypothetical protein
MGLGDAVIGELSAWLDIGLFWFCPVSQGPGTGEESHGYVSFSLGIV